MQASLTINKALRCAGATQQRPGVSSDFNFRLDDCSTTLRCRHRNGGEVSRNTWMHTSFGFGRSTSSLQSERRGAVLVEFAMVLPLIMVISFAMIELSRLMMLQHAADTAAYEGARHAMVPGATAEEAAKAAQELIDANDLHGVSIFVTPSKILEDTPLLTVRVDVPVAKNSWIAFFRVGSYDVSSEVTLYCERPAVVRLSGRPKLKLKKKELQGLAP